MRRRYLFPALLTGVALLATACSDVRPPTAPVAPSFGLSSGPAVSVLTRNLYLGADIDGLLSGEDPAVVLSRALAQIQQTNYPARAQKLAAEILQRMPDAVGLQEVSHYTFVPVSGAPQQLDYVDILLAYLGGQYQLAVRQDNVSLGFPLGGLGGYLAVYYTDGDAILVRTGVPWGNPQKDHYDHQVHLTVAGTSFDNLRGWNTADIVVNGTTYRFANTHLEIQRFRDVQEQQAGELATLLGPSPYPVILVGDFNSAANPSAPAESKTDSYRILRNAGFADIELREPHSNTLVTCCQAADLSNTSSQLNQRLDLVLVRLGHAGFGGQSAIQVFDTFFLAPLPGGGVYPLWASDHAGIFAQLWPAPGLLAKN